MFLQAITRHGKIYSKVNKKTQPSALQDMALTETTKLLFNLTHLAPEKVDLFSKLAFRNEPLRPHEIR